MLGLSSPEGQPSPSHPGSFPGQSALSQGRLWIFCGSPSSSPICNDPQHARLNWLPAEGTLSSHMRTAPPGLKHWDRQFSVSSKLLGMDILQHLKGQTLGNWRL